MVLDSYRIRVVCVLYLYCIGVGFVPDPIFMHTCFAWVLYSSCVRIVLVLYSYCLGVGFELYSCCARVWTLISLVLYQHCVRIVFVLY